MYYHFIFDIELNQIIQILRYIYVCVCYLINVQNRSHSYDITIV